MLSPWLLIGLGVAHGRHHVADRGQEAGDASQSSVLRDARTDALPQKSTNPKSLRCRTAFRICSASNFSPSSRSRSRPGRSELPRMTRRSLNNLVPVVAASSARKKTRGIPGGTEAARIRLAVFLECRPELPQTSGERDGPGNLISDCRPGSAPFSSRRINRSPNSWKRDAVQFDFPRASPQRFRGNNA